MTTIELEAKKASLVREILTEVNDMEFLKKLQKAFDRLKSKSEEDSEYISKEEVLAGIDAGLKEMAERKSSGRKAKNLEELINEL